MPDLDIGLTSMQTLLAEQGYCCPALTLSSAGCAQLEHLLLHLQQQNSSDYAARLLLRRLPALGPWLQEHGIQQLVTELQTCPQQAVRGMLFDKNDQGNWRVPWHRDRCLVLNKRVELDGFGPWSIKDGADHCLAPDHIMQRMLSVRIHLDDCDADNGALHVLPASHQDGQAKPAAYDITTAKRIDRRRGQLLIMRPLLLHRSEPRRIERQRRVVHIDFAGDILPPDLDWYDRCPTQ